MLKKSFLKRTIAFVLSVMFIPINEIGQSVSAENFSTVFELENSEVTTTNIVEESTNDYMETEVTPSEVFPVNLNGSLDSKGISLVWTYNYDNVISYQIFKNNELLIETEDTYYTDLDINGNSAYNYYIQAIDENGNIISVSNVFEISTLENLEISSGTTTLTENIQVFDLKLNGGTLNLNGYTVTVTHNANISNANLKMNNGEIYCDGNFTTSNGAYLYMQSANDYLLVNGDFVWNSYCSSESFLTNGIIEIKGDFIENKYDSFIASSYNKVIMSGENCQTISMIKGNSTFNTIEFKNNSTEGIICARAFRHKNLITNNTKITLQEDTGDIGFILSKDTTIENDYILSLGDLDLNGYTLTINGDFIQQGGVVNINNGTLVVNGNYYIQSRNGENDTNYSYSKSYGLLKMTNDTDHIIVNGNFSTSSIVNHTNYLTNGILEVKGNFTQDSTASYYNFYASENHTLLLNGNYNQMVKFGSNNTSYSRINNLEITNSYKNGIVFEGNPYVVGMINDNGNKSIGYISISEDAQFYNNVYNGSINIISTVTISEDDNVTINGNVSVSSYLYLNGNLTVNGNLDVSSYYGRIIMNNDNGYICVNGNFIYTSTYYNGTFTKGILEIKGDVTISGGFYASGTHKTILSGTTKQTIDMLEGRNFNILELCNTSEEGIYSENVLKKNQLIILNDCKLTYNNSEGVFGWTLSKDETIDGDLVLIDGMLDLNGYSLTVTGDLIHSNGEIVINDGKLTVEGDYRIQARTSNENNEYIYSTSIGILNMTNQNDYVLVKGSFITASTINHTNYLTDGILEVQGDFTQDSEASYYNFYASENHTLLLSGNSNQTVKFGTNNYCYSRINNLEVTNSIENGIIFEGKPYVCGMINQHGNTFNNAIFIGSSTQFYNDVYNGSIYIYDTTTISADTKITINGDLYINSSITINGNLTINGNIYVSSYLNVNGNLTINGDLNVTGYYARIVMNNDNSYICVNEDFIYTSTYYNGTFTKGILEIKGDATISGGFYASGTHKTILNGTTKQTIDMSEDRNFNILELSNTSEEGIYSENILKKNQLIILNDCKLTYNNSEGVFGWTLSDDYIVEGDFTLIDGTLDLNGYSLTVTGDLIQAGGTINISNGTLIIDGNYYIQVRNSDENGGYTYSNSVGILNMTNPNDYVLVKGNFAISSTFNHKEYLTNGVLEVKGDFTQSGSSYGYLATSNNEVILSGDKKQIVSFEVNSSFGNLKISNSSTEGVILKSDVTITGYISDINSKVSGNGIVNISNIDNLEKGIWGGNLKLNSSNKLKSNLNIGQTLTINSNLYTMGYSITANNIDLNSYLYVENAVITTINDFNSNYSSRLIMQDGKGYILVGGNFSMNSQYSHSNYLTDGTLEVRGNFKQISYNNFIATQNHVTILSGKRTISGRTYVQTISFDNPSTCRFNKLILKKSISSYQFKFDVEKLCNELVYDIEDNIPPTPITTLNVTKTTETSISMEYSGASDNTAVCGYEIYRNGIKIGTTSNEFFTDYNLSASSTYTYSIYPFDECRNVATTSPQVKGTTKEDTTPPNKITDFEVSTKTGSTITLKWSKPYDNVGVSKYALYRNGELINDTIKNTNYTDVDLSSDEVYIYTIQAYDNSNNFSEMSDELSVTTAMPKIVSVSPVDCSTINTNTVALYAYFKNVGNSIGNKVKIEYSVDGKNWNIITPTFIGQKNYNNSTLYVSYSWDVSSLTISGDYSVKFTLIDASNNVDEKIVTYNLDRTPPQFPENFHIETDNQTVTLSWFPSISADCCKYVIYRKSANEEKYTKITTVNGKNSCSYIDTDVIANETYSYRISAIDSSDLESNPSEPIDITTTEDKLSPTIKNITPNAGKINKIAKITVNAHDNIKVSNVTLEYMIGEYKENSQWHIISTKKADNDGNAEFNWDTTLLTDGVYTIRATTEDCYGNISEELFTRRYEVDNTGISKIELITEKCKASSTYVELVWNDVPENDFNYFAVEQKVHDEFILIATEKSTLGYAVTNLSPNTEYTFRIVGYDILENRGISSDEITITTTLDTSAPKIKSIEPISTYYKDYIDLKMLVSDNVGIDYGVFSYSLDNENYIEIARVSAKDDITNAEIVYKWDVSELEEGTVYVKFNAYDTSGNKNSLLENGQEVVSKYIIDNTPPKKITNLKAVANDGYISLTWNSSSDDDVSSYIIVREETDIGVNSNLEIECKSLNYYDISVTPGISYTYRIKTVDIAGNVSELSSEVTATANIDNTVPEVLGISLSDNDIIGSNSQISVSAHDNSYLKSVKIEYKKIDSDEEIWSTIGTKLVENDNICYYSQKFNTDGMVEGNYQIRVTAEDIYGNISEPTIVSIFLDLTAPNKPIVSSTSESYKISIDLSKTDMNDETYDDFDNFKIYRRLIGEKDFEYIGQTTTTNYVDEIVEAEIWYDYYVEAYDIHGNYSSSNVINNYALSTDEIPPVAILPENMCGVVGYEILFDGTLSYDNDRICKYEWNMGDNSPILYGFQPTHIYSKSGTYIVTLTVYDNSGNKGSTSTTVLVRESDNIGTNIITVSDASGSPIPNAYVYVMFDKDNILSLRTNSYGQANITGTQGEYYIAVYSQNYLPVEQVLSIKPYETNNINIILTEGEVVEGSLSVHRMTYQEMVDAGVDFSNPANMNSFTYTVTLTFEQTPLPVEYQVVVIGGGYGGYGGTCNIIGSTSSNTNNIQFQAVTPQEEIEEEQPILAYISRTDTISWLKDMYCVELGVLNCADTNFYLQDCMATIKLPSELKLASAIDNTSIKQVGIDGYIPGQTSAKTSWIVTSNENGEFDISASFNGILMPFNAKVSAEFSTTAEFSIGTGEGLHIYIMPERCAYINETYYIQYKLVNESNKTFYSVKTTWGSYTQPDEKYDITVIDSLTGETITYNSDNPDGNISTTANNLNTFILSDASHGSIASIMKPGLATSVNIFQPGDVLYGTYQQTFSAEGDPNEVYYQLIDAVVDTLNENMGVKVSISPIGSHITKKTINIEYQVSSFYGDPIDISTGAYTDEVDIMSVAGPANLSLNLEYNSMITSKSGDVGYGWTHNYETHIEDLGGVIRYYQTPNVYIDFYSNVILNHSIYGRVVDNNIIIDETAPYYGEYHSLSLSMKDYYIIKNEDGTFELHNPADAIYTYNSNGQIVKILDINGKSVSFEYRQNQVEITDDISKQSIVLTYNDFGFINRIEDKNGRVATISYTNGLITEITNLLGEKTTYTYNENNQLISAINGDGVTFVKNTYDDKGRTVEQLTPQSNNPAILNYVDNNTDGSTNIEIIDHNGNKLHVETNAFGMITKTTDANGNITQYEYEDGYILCKEIDSYNQSIENTYDEYDNLISQVDKNGSITTFSYDENSNVTSVTLNSEITTLYEYDDKNRITKSTDERGVITTYKYNEYGNLLSETVEGLGTKYYTYNDIGLLSSTIDMNGNTTQYEYDVYGNIIKSIITGNDNVSTTSFEYDVMQHLISITNSNGATTKYNYNGYGNLVSTEDCYGNVSTIKYNSIGWVTEEINANGEFLKYYYDDEGNLISISYADGTSENYQRDNVGNITKVTYANGEYTQYEYDSLNRKIEEIDNTGTITKYEYLPNGLTKKIMYGYSNGEYVDFVEYSYDNRGNIISETDSVGITNYEYDISGNIIKTTNSLGYSNVYSYDIYNRLIEETDANGNSSYYEYDANGNCIKKTNALGIVTTIEYNSLNLPINITTHTDNKDYTVSYKYDSLGQLIENTDECGNVSKITYDDIGNIKYITDELGNVIVTYNYDSVYNLISETNANGISTNYNYDKLGNLTSTIEYIEENKTTSDYITSYEYDSLGRIIKVIDSMNGISSQTYDNKGNIHSITDPNGGTTTYTYDNINRLISEVNAIGVENTYTYNSSNLLEKFTDGEKNNTFYDYDSLGRIIKIRDNLGIITYSYDGNGNILTVTEEKYIYDDNNNIIGTETPQTITRTYDQLNRVSTYTDYKGNTVKYSYDQIGNLVAIEYPGGQIVHYEYYDNGYLSKVIDWNNEITTYTYYENGATKNIERPDGSKEKFTYDIAGNLIEQIDTRQNGNDVDIINQYIYEYDTSNNIVSISGTSTDNISSISNAEMEYNAENQLIKYNGETVEYDKNGNMIYGPLDGKMVNFVYDCRNRLIAVEDTIYEYDAENVRIATETSTKREEYIVNTNATLSQILVSTEYTKNDDGSYSNGVQTLYVYGDGLISQIKLDNYLFYHYNNIGSTTKITDINGKIVYEYSYGTYGELLSGDTSEISFLYNGKFGVVTDDNGLYYMRARYYNTDIKRFINQDIIVGSIDNSKSLNQYAYVQGNPVSLTDPFGLSPYFSASQFGHGVLDVLGLIPGAGDILDLINAVWYFAEGDVANGCISLLSALPAVGIYVGGLSTSCKTAKYIEKGFSLASNIGQFGIASYNSAQIVAQMYSKYISGNATIGWDTFSEIGSLALNVFGAFVTGRRISSDIGTIQGVMNNTIDLGGCFIAGTLVATEDGLKPIEDIQVGDMVWSENAETGESELKEVTELFQFKKNITVTIALEDEDIVTTELHLFYTKEKGWICADELEVGDTLITLDCKEKLIIDVTKEVSKDIIIVYNFEVKDNHNYYVGDNEVLVHNAKKCKKSQNNTISQNVKVPTVRNNKFNNWFNSLTSDELNDLWKDEKIRETIKQRLRSPGGLHEWHLVSRTPKFKEWGVTAEQIKDLRTATKDVEFVNPVGIHGGYGSTTAHNELLEIIDSSLNYETFKRRLNNWASYRLKGGISSLPNGLQLK